MALRWLTICLLLLTTLALSEPSLPEERFWVAGRYDGNRVIVYFDAVKFGDKYPAHPVKIASPVAFGFFDPVELPAAFITKYENGPGAEKFAVGNKYDLLGEDGVGTITLTSLVGFEGDEFTGNNSYIGALGTIGDEHGLGLTQDYYVVGRHHEDLGRKSRLLREPVRFDVQSQAVSLMVDRMKASPLSFAMDAFRLADGSLRYYARAQADEKHAMAAWMSPSPNLHILATEHQTSTYGFDAAMPILRNAVNLGNGKTGVIVSISGEDSTALQLREFRDGFNLTQMRLLQSVDAAE